MSLRNERARGVAAPASEVLKQRFKEAAASGEVAAQYVSTLNGGVVFGVAGLPFPAPVCAALLAEESICEYVSACAESKYSVLIAKKDGKYSLFVEDNGGVGDLSEEEEGKKILSAAAPIIEYASEWG